MYWRQSRHVCADSCSCTGARCGRRSTLDRDSFPRLSNHRSTGEPPLRLYTAAFVMSLQRTVCSILATVHSGVSSCIYTRRSCAALPNSCTVLATQRGGPAGCLFVIKDLPPAPRPYRASCAFLSSSASFFPSYPASLSVRSRTRRCCCDYFLHFAHPRLLVRHSFLYRSHLHGCSRELTSRLLSDRFDFCPHFSLYFFAFFSTISMMFTGWGWSCCISTGLSLAPVPRQLCHGFFCVVGVVH